LKSRIVPCMTGAKLQPKKRECASFYNVTSGGESEEISRRIGSMGDS
jgi:hypothetical protein